MVPDLGADVGSGFGLREHESARMRGSGLSLTWGSQRRSTAILSTAGHCNAPICAAVRFLASAGIAMKVSDYDERGIGGARGDSSTSACHRCGEGGQAQLLRGRGVIRQDCHCLRAGGVSRAAREA